MLLILCGCDQPVIKGTLLGVEGSFMKLHLSHSKQICYTRSKLGGYLTKVKGHFFASAGLTFKRFSWKCTLRIPHAHAVNGISFVKIGEKWMAIYLENKVLFQMAS